MAEDAPIEVTITEFIKQDLLQDPNASVSPDQNLFSSGLIDSIGIMRLIAHIEKTLAMKIPPTDLVPTNFRSVAAMSRYLNEATSTAPR
ncbi:MAG: acyl carrier protein [Verrucomicrobiota bacterium]